MVLRQALIDMGQGSVAHYTGKKYDGDPWPIFATGEPSNPDDCVTIYNTQGQSDGRTTVDGEIQEHHGFQVRLRSANKDSGHAKLSELRRVMAEVLYQRSVAIPGVASRYLIHCVAKLGSVLEVGTDSPGSTRTIFTLNGLMAITRVS